MTGGNALTGVDYRRTLFSPRWFMENMLWIVTKEKRLEKFLLNQEQSAMMDHIEFCLANELPVRIIVLKARQIGATTFFAALGFWLTAMNRNQTYGIVAHRLDSAESIFQKCKIFYNNLPREMQPATTQMSTDGITFDRKNGAGINSKIQFATVNEGVYRGQTLSYLHLSECAFWERDVQAVENSLAPTVAVKPRTIVVRESTANGYNFFKDDWDRAVKGKSEYTPFFFPWHTHEEYRMDVPRGFLLTEEEEALKLRFGLDDGQVMWRRYQIDNSYSGNDMWFKQENPMTPEEAFVAAGTGVFDSETILKGYETCVEPEKVSLTSVQTFEKLLVWEQPARESRKIYAQKAEFSEEKQEYVYVDTDLVIEERTWWTPYTVSIDTAGMGADKNQIVVTNNVTKRMAARYGKKHISEESLAAAAVEIAIMYNNALIVPEVNYSHEICNYILKLGYTNIYITENLPRQDMKLVGGITYGFRTTLLTKPAIISALRARLNADPSIIRDREFWYEAEYYLMLDPIRNKMGAASGHFDDIVVAAAIGQYVSDSFQAKQSNYVVLDKDNPHFLAQMLKKDKKKTILRKGIYKNNA